MTDMHSKNGLFNSLRSLGGTLEEVLRPAQLLNMVQPPDWLVDEIQQRMVLLLNHVLQQEPEAMQRLQRQQGKVIALHWKPFELWLTPTPAGLLNVAQTTTAEAADTSGANTETTDAETAAAADNADKGEAAHAQQASAPDQSETQSARHADLSITITEQSPLALLRAAVRNDKPATRIEGDVQLAAEINWLTDHVRWDVEEDLSRLVGDAAAYRIASTGRQAAQQLKTWAAKMTPPASESANNSGNGSTGESK